MPTKAPTLLPPVPSDALISACVSGECVLFAGAGLSKRVGFPTWSDLVTDLLDWATRNNFVEESWARSRRVSIEKGDGGVVVDGIIDALEGQQTALNDYLTSVFKRTAKLSSVHTKLRDINFCAALTTNFDNLLEQTFERQNPPIYTPNDAEQLIEALHKRDFFILKLYGDLSRTDSLMISPTQFEDAINENLPFSQFMETLFLSKTLLFIGASLEGIEDYLKGVGLKKQKTPREHWALVGVTDEYSWQAKAESLKRRYGIGIMPYRINPRHTAVVEFIRLLQQRVGATAGTDAKDSVPHLNRIQLENIGPFEYLELKLEPDWNILLGDNGVGKSNILRAIALAICGKDAQPYADRLIKVNATSANIILDTDRNTYKTELLKTTSGPAQMETIPVRALDAEGWLAIGFPALRTMSSQRPQAPQKISKSIPTSDDLLPLVKGDPDPRLDKLKQWIVNLDYLRKDEQSKTGSPGGRYERLLNKFFEYVSILTENVTIKRGEVNPSTYEISVITDDGPLPIEAISQGMTSLIGWVGILLQRLYEIYDDDDEDPTQRFALILMDEIDAHLHPGWQQTLVSNLSKVFPKAQFIATTHSPLIVGGMPPEQVFRFARDEEGKVVQLNVDQAMTVGRADQILTGELFGLKTTLALDEDTQEDLNEYKELLGKTHHTPEEENRFEELRRRLHSSMPMSGETRTERERQAQEREKLLQAVQAATADSQSKVEPPEGEPASEKVTARKSKRS